MHSIKSLELLQMMKVHQILMSPEKDLSPRHAGEEGGRRRWMKPYLPLVFACSVSLMPQTLMVLWGGSKLSVLG